MELEHTHPFPYPFSKQGLLPLLNQPCFFFPTPLASSLRLDPHPSGMCRIWLFGWGLRRKSPPTLASTLFPSLTLFSTQGLLPLLSHTLCWHPPSEVRRIWLFWLGSEEKVDSDVSEHTLPSTYPFSMLSKACFRSLPPPSRPPPSEVCRIRLA